MTPDEGPVVTVQNATASAPATVFVVRGKHFPILSDSSSTARHAVAGYDFPNFCAANLGYNAWGHYTNTSWDGWGIVVVSSTSTTLQFELANGTAHGSPPHWGIWWDAPNGAPYTSAGYGTTAP